MDYKQQVTEFVTKELALIQGGWQSLELRMSQAKHSAEVLVERLFAENHLQYPEVALTETNEKYKDKVKD